MKMKLPVIRGRIGDWVYYSGLMTFSQIDDRVTASIGEIYQASCLDELLQRDLTKNYEDISRYLLNDTERFFNALILAIYDGDPQWLEVEFPTEERDYTNVGFLQFSDDETIFPVDGQHRVAGIKEALKADPSLGPEQIPVIFIAHQQTEEGRKRTRKLFSTLNRRAKPVGQNENIALDEDDVCAIITRELIHEHPLFLGDNVVNSQGKQIPRKNNKAFTSLITLYQCVQSFVLWEKTKDGFTKRAFKKYLYQRPSEEEITALYDKTVDFFNSFTKNTPSLTEYVARQGEKAADYRNSSGGNLLFRPIALTEFLSAALKLYNEEEHSFDPVFRKLSRVPLIISEEPWRGLLWDGARIINRASRPLIQSIILYLSDPEMLDKKRYSNMVEGYAKAINAAPEYAEQILHRVKNEM